MSIAVSVLPGASYKVQIVVDEVPEGASWRVTGHVGSYVPGLAPGDGLAPSDVLAPAPSVFTPGDWSWTVPGGYGVGDGGQVVLTDIRSPGNVPVVYQFTAGGVVAESNVVVVPFQNDIVLQTGDGLVAVDVELLAESLGLSWEPQIAQFRVPGRERPVARYDVLGVAGSQFRVRVPMTQTKDLHRVLASGGPIVYRFGAAEGSYDLDPVGVVLVGAVSSVAVPTADLRFWSLGYTPVDDPFAGVRLGASPWDEFDSAFTGRPWDHLDEMFTGLDWDAFDRQVWTDA